MSRTAIKDPKPDPDFNVKIGDLIYCKKWDRIYYVIRIIDNTGKKGVYTGAYCIEWLSVDDNSCGMFWEDLKKYFQKEEFIHIPCRKEE